MPEVPETHLEIDLRALSHNYTYLRSKLTKETRFLGVVKAFAYGNDSLVIAETLVALGADYLAVAYVNEGVLLREAGIELPILVLHPQVVNFNTLIEHCLEPSLYSIRTLRAFIKAAESKAQKDYPVHIKFNTGLNRLGFKSGDESAIASLLNETNAVRVKSVFSHLAASEDLSERPFTLGQISAFKDMAGNLSYLLGYEPMKHMCNTSGVINYPEGHFDMVRCGIGLYGFGNTAAEDAQLKPIASLKTVISQIHDIEKGETVGYNRAYRAEKAEKVATLPLGHADGISRYYGNKTGYVTIHGQKAAIIGNVCMDMIMVNITNIDCAEGDEVLVFGQQQPVTRLAESVGTISYEILTAISQRVKRVFLPL
jgi:alanine racemase